jgi:hypothetical protein
VNSREFKRHIAELLARKHREEAQAATATERSTTAKRNANTTRHAKAPVAQEQPAPEAYQPKITFRIRRNRHR